MRALTAAVLIIIGPIAFMVGAFAIFAALLVSAINLDATSALVVVGGLAIIILGGFSLRAGAARLKGQPPEVQVRVVFLALGVVAAAAWFAYQLWGR